MAHDVFISYSSKDKIIADAVCARLEARGIRCWIAPRDVHPGLPYGEEIIDGIQNSKVMVLVFSSHANTSPHIPKEIERAVSHGISVIPLRVEAVTPAKSLDYFISSVHWLDAITPPLEQHLESLANTILAIVPQRAASSVAVPQSVSVVRPAAASAPPPPTATLQPPPKNNIGLFVGIGAVVVIVIAAIAYFMTRESETGVKDVSGPPSQISSSNPGRVSNSPGTAAATGDPIVGCWNWFNNVPVIIKPDGTAVGGPFTAHWRVASGARHTYALTWPESVDTLTLSGDGRTLSGGNQYGFTTTATRLTPGVGALGMWSWHGGAIVIQPDGTFLAGTFRGRWRMATANSVNLTWPNPVDTLTMSPDRQRLSGSDQYGIKISGTRMASCGG